MSYPRRPERPCAWCGAPFRGTYAAQQTCSRSCRSQRQWALRAPNRTAFVAAGREAQRRKRIATLKAKLAGVRTLGEAYRLGYQAGYQWGWAVSRRRPRSAA